MNEVKSFRDLRTWQEGHELTLEVYRITAAFPPEERYGLVSQMRRSVSSIPTNIAEGMGRGTTKDLIRFLITARGSLQEIRYQILLAKDLHYLDNTTYEKLEGRLNGLGAGLNTHINSLERNLPPNGT